MAAPTTTARGTPTGRKLKDGFPSKIAFSRTPAMNIWEKTLGLPPVDGGDAIDTTTMLNTSVMTRWHQYLVDYGEFTVSGGYDPGLYDTAYDDVNVNQEITRYFADGSTIDFWGYIRRVEFAEASKGTFPEVTLTIVPTNEDNDGNEQAPVLTSVTGT